jgi:hypothetical protein
MVYEHNESNIWPHLNSYIYKEMIWSNRFAPFCLEVLINK